MSARSWRWPVLVLLPLLVLVGLAIEGDEQPEEAGATPVAPSFQAPDAGTRGSTWYCAAGSATGAASGESAGPAEQVVIVANLADEPVDVELTAYPEGGEPVTRTVPVAADGRANVTVGDIVTAEWASVVVEAGGGQVAVEHLLSGPEGRTVAPCASRPSTTWYFPAGTTRPGTRYFLTLFNPFPDEASVDITLESEIGARTPEDLQGIVVPGSSTEVQEIGGETRLVTEREELAASVVARNGRIVVEQLMVSDGTPSALRNDAGERVGNRPNPVGISAAVGAPEAAPAWVFPEIPPPPSNVDAESGSPVRAEIAVLNPSDRDAEVEVQIFLEDPEVNSSVEPFSLSIPPGRYRIADLLEEVAEEGELVEGRIPAGVRSWALVRSTNHVPVVAQLVHERLDDTVRPGSTTMLGSPVVATGWVLPAGSLGGVATARTTVVNPAAVGEARVRLVGRAGGDEVELPGTEIVVPPGEARWIDMTSEGRDVAELAVEVTSDRPVVVGRWFGFSGGVDVASSLAIPVAGTYETPIDLAIPVAVEPEPPVTEAPDVTQPTGGDDEGPATTAGSSSSTAGGG